MERRTWNLEEYEKKAKDRATGEDAAKAGDKRPLPTADSQEKEEFRPAEKGAAGPERSKRAFLQARRGKVDDIDSRVGSTEIVSAEAAATTSTRLDDDATGSIKVRLYDECCCVVEVHTSRRIRQGLTTPSILTDHSLIQLLISTGRDYKNGSWLAL